MPTLKPAVLQDFARRLLAAGGMTPQEAEVTSASLVGANLRGYDSHGVMRIPYYVQSIAEGETVSQAKLEVSDEGSSRIVANANWGVGQVQAVALLKQLVPKARESGVAIASVTQCERCSSSSSRATDSSALVAAETWVSTSMQYASDSTMRCNPRTCPSTRRSRLRWASL